MTAKLDHYENVISNLSTNSVDEESVLLNRIENISKNPNKGDYNAHDNHCKFGKSGGGGHVNVCYKIEEKELIGTDEEGE